MDPASSLPSGDVVPLLPPAVPRSLYIHVPFCAHHCGYCNFSVIAGRSDLVGVYLQAIGWELSQLPEPAVGGRWELDTLYFGGGTPTQLSDAQLGELLEIVRRRFATGEQTEFTVEANPADIDEAKITVLAELGVNRISLGAQSFDGTHLKLLERDHGAEKISQAVALARAAGIDSVALDLIFAVPGQTLDDWRRDLQLALALSPSHISTYGLTFEKGTAFYNRLTRGALTQAPEELEREMYLLAIDTLCAAGWEHYEVSNFARPGQRSRHNETYWSGQPWFAAGPGAASYFQGRRETNHRSVTTYLKLASRGESVVVECEQLSPEDAARERLVFGLRRMEGVSLKQFHCETGFAIEELIADAVRKLTELGLLEIFDKRLRLTRAGLLVSDSIWPELL